ncbi:MAG TPA: hypothetical protein VH165_02460 [Kofleriaceae bacterium]|nr:hypothetical protein [Kofleriaceae bacterium]
MKLLVNSLLMSSMLVAGCYAEDQAQPQYAGGAEEDDNGDLVEISPGVEVVADYDEPIFFSDGFYWANRGGVWYSSGWYRGGWTRADRVPEHVRGISNPERFAHYRPAGYAPHAPVHGGTVSHAQYHASHPVGGSVHVRAAVRGGGHHR